MATINGKPASQLTTFGHEMRKHFLFDEGFVNLNHGSFGTYPRPIRDTLRDFQDQAEATPDPFIRFEYPRRLAESRRAMASFLNVPVEEVVFVPNATTAINTVLRNLTFNEGDKIAYFSTIYGACEKTVDYITETTPAGSVKVEYTYPVSDDWMVQQFRDLLRAEKVKVAIFDTVVSVPGLRMPFERLAEACREADVLSIVDAAHGVGHIPLDLRALKADFTVSNAHKWLFVPRGCAVFHIPLRNQHLIRSSLPTSHGFEPLPVPGKKELVKPIPLVGESAFVQNFQFVGTIDNSPYLCIPAALKFRNEVCGGEEKIMTYCRNLAKEAGEIVSTILGTNVLDNEEGTLTNCFFANVRLPLAKQPADVGVSGVAAVTQFMTRTMTAESKTFMQITFYNNNWWVRLSATIYLEITDFEWAAGVLKDLCGRAKKGEYLKGQEEGIEHLNL
ncbi:MAG: hypothetical protein M1812_004059 [Candelaria pacifica]|nr:MAG: hypothetical protein M1812_004059 [Candelaria pacifica]